ncbi:MAG: Y-family DNA polymerase [Deltaproteobacteria bacterium]|jgi:DNA polymerase V|nr:Y-family DNA polymerase [Deltaproteobacteria bacterium]
MSFPVPPKAELWALVDCNAFYCSCERLFRPDLKDKPVAVLSNNDGCLVALSPETKALGFKGGQPYFQQALKLKQSGVAVFSSNYSLYGDISRRVMTCLESVVPDVGQYSIDEAFIPLAGSAAADPLAVGWELCRRVMTWVGMPVRVGIGPTRTIAKLASHWAKKMGRVFRLEADSGEYGDILAQTQVSDVWGIGRGLSEKLNKTGIFSALELSRLRPAAAKKLLTVRGLKTVLELNGTQAIDGDFTPVHPKSFVSSRSFGRKVETIEPLSEALAGHAASIGAKLRAAETVAAVVSVFIGTAHYADRPFQTGATVLVPEATDYTPRLMEAVRKALKSCFRPGFKYARAGVMAFDLRPKTGPEEISLSGPPTDRNPAPNRPDSLMAALDRINHRYGRETVRFSAQGQPEADWRMKREKLSEISTTDWGGLPRVRV